MTLGESLRRRRKESGLTMGQLSRRLKVSVVLVSAVERNLAAPPSLDDWINAITSYGQGTNKI